MDLYDILVKGVFLTEKMIEYLKIRESFIFRCSIDLGLIFLGLILLSTILNVKKKKGFWLGIAGLSITSFFVRSKIAGGVISLLFMAKFWKSMLVLIAALFLVYQGIGDLLLFGLS